MAEKDILKKHEEESFHKSSSLFRRFEHYLGEFVYGGIDGSVTTFAVVSGAVGAGLDSAIIIILGFANLLADGFSMSVGAYLSSKSEKDNYHKHRNIEAWEVEQMPEAEKEEIREIYRHKGFDGELLEKIVDVITEDKDRWIDVMMKEELEMMEEPRSPFLIGLMTYISFISIGLIPLLIYVIDFVDPVDGNLFFYASSLTAIAFVFIGVLKSYVTETTIWKGVLETLILGIIAALVAYFVGDVLERIIAG